MLAPPVRASGHGCRGLLAEEPKKILNVVELFAGAGGMGLGFMLATRAGRKFRLVFSGEMNPIYVETLRRNHRYFSRMQREIDHCDSEDIHPIDLDKQKAINLVSSSVREAGGVDVLIGGPPCQGFSSANRNSWSADNPNNHLVNVFMEYVDQLRPPCISDGKCAGNSLDLEEWEWGCSERCRTCSKENTGPRLPGIR